MSLTKIECDGTVCPPGKPRVRLADGHGMSLEVTAAGGKYWPTSLLFPGERAHERPMSNNTILAALKCMGYAGRMTGHGFRGIASTILHEQGYPHHLIELQLAHRERDQVAAAHNHASHLAERRTMMKEWAAHLDKLRRGADVIALNARAA